MLVVVALLAPLVALVVHEAGHALAAAVLGGRAIRLRRIPWGAAVEATLDEDRRVAFLLAGPLASVAFGAALWSVGGWWGVAGAVSVAFGALTLVGSDGRQALAAARAVAWARAKSNDSR